jgi:hypothetical protein
MSGLEVIDLYKTKVTDKGVKDLKRSLPPATPGNPPERPS